MGGGGGGMCGCVCVTLASDSSETIKVIIITRGTVTASYMVMHLVLIILTLTFIGGRIGINDENNKCSIISEPVQAMHITFAVKIVRLKVYKICSQSNDLALHSKS